MSLSILFLSLLLHFSLQQKPYDFRPESRYFEINDGEDTAFIGFDQIANDTIFGNCYIHSDTISISYPIYEDGSNVEYTPDKYFNGFNPYNGTSVCGFYFDQIDDKFPLKWTLTAFDNKTAANFTEEVSVTFYYNMPLYLDSIVAAPDASMVNLFFSGNTKWIKCVIEFDNTTLNLDINAIKIYNDNELKSRITSLGEGRCGYKINKLEVGDPAKLILYGTDDKNKVYKNTAQLTVRPAVNLSNHTLEVYVGESATVRCGKETDGSADFDQKYCHLFNPRNELVSHDHMCLYDLDIVTLSDLGTWRCSVGYDTIMDSLEFTTEVKERKPESVIGFTEDSDDFYILGCRLDNFENSGIQFCKFTRPDGKLFKVDKGAANANYNSFTADLDNGRCSIEIAKPLRDEDKGTWKCEAAAGQKMSGTFIDVETSTKFPYNKYIQKNVQLGNSFFIDCMVPYSSDYCWIIAPNKTQYKPDDSLQITTGVCLLEVTHSTPTDNGTWQCSIAQKNGIPDEIITVDISIIDLKVLYTNAEATEGEETELICNTNGIPIEYCRFSSTSGSSYSLRKENSDSPNKKISYKGRGLEYGDCGIKISKVEASDSGQWGCHISSGRNNYINKADLTKKIQLTVNSPGSNTTLAEAVGISLGVLAVVIATGGFMYYKYSGRCVRGSTGATAEFPARTSNGSGETVILSTGQNTYNT